MAWKMLRQWPRKCFDVLFDYTFLQKVSSSSASCPRLLICLGSQVVEEATTCSFRHLPPAFPFSGRLLRQPPPSPGCLQHPLLLHIGERLLQCYLQVLYGGLLLLLSSLDTCQYASSAPMAVSAIIIICCPPLRSSRRASRQEWVLYTQRYISVGWQSHLPHCELALARSSSGAFGPQILAHLVVPILMG